MREEISLKLAELIKAIKKNPVAYFCMTGGCSGEIKLMITPTENGPNIMSDDYAKPPITLEGTAEENAKHFVDLCFSKCQVTQDSE